MKLVHFIAVLAMALPFSTQGSNPILPSSTETIVPTTNYYSLNKIFFDDEAGTTLFIDFEMINDELVKLNIIRDEQVMMSDDLSGLPSDSIYEINLNLFRQGTYTIELVTSEKIKIQKVVTVN